jgi:hypothetical protein
VAGEDTLQIHNSILRGVRNCINVNSETKISNELFLSQHCSDGAKYFFAQAPHSRGLETELLDAVADFL